MRSVRPLVPLAALLVLLSTRHANATETGFSLTGAPPGADVYLDGERIGATPLSAVIPCASGEHTIRVARPGFAPYIDVFKVRDGRVTKLEVELVPVSGVLRLKASPDQARVFIDGQFAGEAPLETELKIGPHRIQVTRFGFRDQSFTVHAVAGEVIERTVQLVELPAGLNPYKPLGPPPARWYERWWVWTAGAAAVATLAVAIIVPTVDSMRNPCDRIGANVCILIPAAAVEQPLHLGLSF